MFEKKAEEYASNLLKGVNCNMGNPRVRQINSIDVEEAFKDGAEFGYNKAKEDAGKMKSRFLELCHLKDMRIEELEKANEWHYVKDGDLPKENKKYWILTSSGEPKVDSWLGVSWVTSYEVIAWKEIVLPKENE